MVAAKREPTVPRGVVRRKRSVGGSRVVIIKMSQVAACPTNRLDPSHYRDDGNCKCQPTEGSG